MSMVIGLSEEIQNPSVEIVQLLPEDLIWQENPALWGLQSTLLLGNPNEAKSYVQRLKIPPHFKVMPHAHSNPFRMVTVLSGTFYQAFGEEFDESKLKAFPVGSFFTEPENKPHYGMTKEEGVILQLNAIGPAGTEYIKK